MASGSGKKRLASYLEDVLERLGAEGFAPDEEELRTKIMPSVVRSVRRLLAGAPAELVTSIRALLTDTGVLPSYDADLGGFQQALTSCLEVLAGREADPDSDAEEAAEEDVSPSEEELQSFAAVVARLWDIDGPFRLQEGEDYRLNYQSRAASLSSLTDRCSDPFFEFVDEGKLRGMPCSSTFVKLLDNYERETDDDEVVTNEERQEMDRFLRQLMQTPHMRYAHQVLVSWGVAKPDMNRFAAQVFDIWFTPYSVTGRRGPKSSSGFEHVCVGEEKVDNRTGKSSVIGFHNWIRFWSQERAGNVDYRGYVGHLSEDKTRVVSVRFAWEEDGDDEVKPVSTFLIGTSVAFEFAMFTIAFLGYGGEASQGGVMLGDIGPVKITTWPWKTSLGTVVRSAFVEVD